MGNEQSIISAVVNPVGVIVAAGSATNWKWCQVERIEKSPYSIKFFLDKNVEYSNTYASYIHCTNSYPYYNVHAGEYIQINQGKTESYNSSHEFTSSDNLRVIRISEGEYVLVPLPPRPGYGELFRVTHFGNWILIGTGEFVLERKKERRGDIEVEYIEKVTVTDSKVEYRVETWYRASTS